MKVDQSSGDEGQRGRAGLGARDTASRRLHQPVAFPLGGKPPRVPSYERVHREAQAP